MKRTLLRFAAGVAMTVLPSLSPGAETPDTTAAITLFNVSGWTLIPKAMEVADGDTTIARLSRKSYRVIRLAPGRHELATHGRKLPLVLQAGESRYVVYGYNPERSWAFPLGGDPVVIREITAEEAGRLKAESSEVME